jgi:hypothetical protein
MNIVVETPDGSFWHIRAERAYQRFGRYRGLSRHWPTSLTRIAVIGSGQVGQNLLPRANPNISGSAAMSLVGEGRRFRFRAGWAEPDPMYGPPLHCRNKIGMDKRSCTNVFGVNVELRCWRTVGFPNAEAPAEMCPVGAGLESWFCYHASGRKLDGQRRRTMAGGS